MQLKVNPVCSTALHGRRRDNGQLTTNTDRRVLRCMTKSLMVFAIGLTSLIAAHAAASPGILGVAVKVEGGWPTIVTVHDNFPASRESERNR